MPQISLAQHKLNIEAVLDSKTHSIDIKQEIVYYNNSNQDLNEIYLLDWANSFSSKTTPLAKRFTEDFKSAFHFEKNKLRGKTNISSISSDKSIPLQWQREEADIIKVVLDRPLKKGERYSLFLNYSVQLPKERYTRYGITRDGDYSLRYWYISPAVYDGKWQVYSNKNLDDFYLLPSQFHVSITIPSQFSLISNLDIEDQNINKEEKTIILKGENRNQVKLFLLKNSAFISVLTDTFEVVTDLENGYIDDNAKALSVDRIVRFLEANLGKYPFKKMMVSQLDYRENPVYGLNQLPDFISPFPYGFLYDIEQFKTISAEFLENTLILNPRKDHWFKGALHIYLLIKYTNKYYPNMKIVGNLSNWPFLRWTQLFQLEFNDQYPMLYMNMARRNLDQALTVSRDSLLKFNKNIASDYKGGIGFLYLNDYLGQETVDESIKTFYTKNVLQKTTGLSFLKELELKSKQTLDWFYEDYINSNKRIDFKIKELKKQGDSIAVTIKNKQKNSLPVSLSALNKKGEVLFKTWVTKVDSLKTITLPAKDIKKVVLNHEAIIPEYNLRNNFKRVSGLFNKPLQLRLFQDVEDHRYNQTLLTPVSLFNIYDGFAIGARIFNKTLLPKEFHYSIQPYYGLRSKAFVGNVSLAYKKFIDKRKFRSITYGLSGSRFSYNEGLFFNRFSPFVILSFRDINNLRSNKTQSIILSNITVSRDQNPLNPAENPDYSVINFKYIYSNPNLINYFGGEVDLQLSSKFSKISTTIEYRKLFLSNRQINLRFFVGAFLRNKTSENSDFFSFALDRPTDYLFNYDYIGRNEDTGLFSQQIILAEGGFKSKLRPAFANSWISTLNVNTSIWRWVQFYADVGLVHNKKRSTHGVYDSGIRLSLVEDFFELYFPLYSNKGWEPGLPNYGESIRFVIVLSPRTLIKLFTRRWY